jgi:DNA integrity scanning protein DisA with diadenylate cyclase activity
MNSWRLIFNQAVLLHVKSGIPIEINPYDLKIKESIDTYSAMFPQTEFNEINLSELLKTFIKYMIEERNGGIIVISLDAQEEARRLSSNSFKIEGPPKLTTENINLFSKLAKIDGAILLDDLLYCHAFGVILDGDKTDKASLSRGARYNSALRYVENKQANRVLAIVISVDGMIDVFTKNEEVPTSL